MDISKHYSKSISKVFKKNFDKDLEKFKSEFLPIFVDCGRMLPEDVSTEIFNRFVTFSERDYKEALYHLVNVFELFEENYDIANDPFNEEEWEYIKLVINDSTEEFGLELVQYIMQVMLDLNII
ncbi:MAG: hypothetical protein OCD02_08820 [Spirochaetaceae bacterium]